MIKLNIGAGPNLFPGWINLDREDMSPYLQHLRVARDFNGWPQHQIDLALHVREGRVTSQVHDLRNGFPNVPDNQVDAIYLGQVIEHLNPQYEVQQLLRECARILKPGAPIRITTPDLRLLVNAYLDRATERFSIEQPAFYRGKSPGAQLSYILFGASGPQCTWDHYEGHMCGFDEESMTEALREAGFTGSVGFQRVAGTSWYPVFGDCVDAGMSHSFAAESAKP